MSLTGSKTDLVFYYTQNNERLFLSLELYFKFVYGINLVNAKKELFNLSMNNKIIILDTEKWDEQFLDIIEKHSIYSVISICNSLILSKNFKVILLDLLSRAQSEALFSQKELKDKLNNFFRGHGEESIFQVLNTIIYGFQNYTCFASGGLNVEEYKNYFLNPALIKWALFQKKYKKYRVFLKLLGYHCQIKKINEYCDVIDLFEVNNLIIEKNSVKVQSIVELLKELEYILTDISIDLELADGSIDNFNCN